MANDDPLQLAIDNILDQHEADGAFAAHLTALCVASGHDATGPLRGGAAGEFLYRDYIVDFAVGIRALASTMMTGTEASWPPHDRPTKRRDESSER